MKDQYDFTGAERGKFYREGAVFVIGLEMEPALSRRLTAAAMRKDITTTELLDQMLKREEEEAAASAP